MPESRDSYKRESDSADRDREERRKRRRSRWGGDEKDKAFILGMPTVLPTNLSKEQEEAYLLQLQIEEVSRKLRTGELGIPPNPEDRSPSPEPIYSSDGKRLNTREYRTRKKLEEERHNLIQQMLKLNPDFKPPADYKPPIIRVSDKVMIPQDDHPDINFVGLLIGPRGNTLKSMERDTGAKIIIRGKGSVKEGKVGRKDGQPLPGEDEPLHAYVTANNPECVKKAVDKIKEIIRQGVEVPEGQNDLRRMQLRELALLNGTLRENDGPRCSNCGSSEHKSWMCPDKPNVTNNIVCSSCGGAGHIAKDCRQKRPGAVRDPTVVMHDKAKIDEEYMSLMAELGEGPPPPVSSGSDRSHSIMTTSSSGGLFDRQMAPRAITAAPPPPVPTPTPTQLIPNTLPPPPWSQQPPPPKANLTQPPPSSTTPTLTLPPPPWQATAATLTTSIPPPILNASMPPPIQTQQPPPPPPPQPHQQQQQLNVASLLSWMQPQLTQTIMQQQPPPPPRPIPPPVAATTSIPPPPPALPPWQQSIPPPSQPPPTTAFWTQNYVIPPPPSTAAAPPPVRPPPPFHTLFQSQPPPPGLEPSSKP